MMENTEYQISNFIDDSTNRILNQIDKEINLLGNIEISKSYEQDHSIKYKNFLMELLNKIENYEIN